MDPLFYVMAIMGCSDGSEACAQARVEPAQYRTIAACQAAMPQVLMRNSDLSFPVITATCRGSGIHMVDRRPAAPHPAAG
ncbi:MAG: hypothetical protein K2P79_05700 [Sphingomonas sp.]|nr:hypothetical protein [Sphingomonas sp.]